MNMTPDYLAGLFDGEGCIDVQVMYPQAPTAKGRLYVRPRVRLCMADSARPLMELIHHVFGGHIVSRKSTMKNQQSSWSLEWLSNDAIRELLLTILPHLILKREQAKLALWWLDTASGRQSKQSEFPGMEKARHAFKNEMQAMKRDPQRLSERAAEEILRLMRQSDHTGDRVTGAEMTSALA
jgi:LAGLIDADG endonuclease